MASDKLDVSQRSYLARCHCGQLTASLSFTSTSQASPLDLTLCACNTCRALTGHLAMSYLASVQSDQASQPTIFGTPKRYASSTKIDRCFCSTCGTSVFNQRSDIAGKISLSGGALVTEESSAGADKKLPLTRYDGMCFAKSTIDGGLAAWTPQADVWPEGKGFETKLKGGSRIGAELRLGPRATDDEKPSERLDCSCHCGGVRFFITRPNADSFKNDWPAKNIPKWHPDSKYTGAICACDSCRIASGYQLAPWVYVPWEHIRDSLTGEKYDFGKAEQGAESLTAYSSSEGVTRFFCGTCGSKLFYRVAKHASQVDVAAGVMKSKSGARAEDWIEWEGSVCEIEDAGDDELVNLIAKGLKEWKLLYDAEMAEKAKA